jgi:hypothetical protein
MNTYENGTLHLDLQVKPGAAAQVICDILHNDHQAVANIPWATVWQVKGGAIRTWIHARLSIGQPIPEEIKDILYRGSAYDIRCITQYLRPQPNGKLPRKSIPGLDTIVKTELEKISPKRLDKIWKAASTYTYLGCSELLVNYLPESYLPLALAIAEKKQSKMPSWQKHHTSGLDATLKAINARFRNDS